MIIEKCDVCKKRITDKKISTIIQGYDDNYGQLIELGQTFVFCSVKCAVKYLKEKKE